MEILPDALRELDPEKSGREINGAGTNIIWHAAIPVYKYEPRTGVVCPFRTTGIRPRYHGNADATGKVFPAAVKAYYFGEAALLISPELT